MTTDAIVILELITNSTTGIFTAMNTEIFTGFSLLTILTGFFLIMVVTNFITWYLTRGDEN